jgi:hypothetical protein
MNYDNNKEQELRRKEQEIQDKEQQLRLRELELEINQPETPLYSTTKYKTSPSKLEILSKKLIKFAKFIGFTVGTIALLRLGLIIGMWLAYGFITLIIIFIGYQVFLKEDNK